MTGSGVFRLQHSPPRDNDEIREFLLFSCDIHCSGDVCSRSHVWLVGKGFDHDRLDTKCTVFIYGWQWQTRTDQRTNSEATKLILVNRFRTAIHDRILHMSLKNNKIIHNIQYNH